MAIWYDNTPTVWSQGNGHTVYINATEDMVKELEKTAKDWVDKAKAEGSFITIVRNS